MPKENQIPAKYLCSITGQIMIDPVMAGDGYTYEREAIEQWLQTHDTSPRTNEKLDHKKLTANHDKRSDILDFLDIHPELYEGDEIYLPNAWVAECVTAIKQNQLQAIQRWLDKDKRLLTLKLEDDATALHLACEFSSPELVEILLKNLKQKNKSVQPGAVGFKSIHLNVLLEKALTSGDSIQCELLLKLGAEVEQPEVSSQNTLLHRMVINDNPEAVSWLLEQKAVLESRNTEGNTPLLLSVIHNHTKLAEFLLKKGAITQVKNLEQQSPVLMALLNKNESMLSLLVGVEKATLPALHFALELNDNEIIKALLKQKVGTIEARDEQQRTPFYNAVEKGNPEAAALLLEEGADPTISCGAAQANTLHVAAERGDVEMLKYLLQTKAAVLLNVQNAKGDTPLHLAVQVGHDSIISLLLEAGAYHKIKNEQDQTPIELAMMQQKPKLANLIVQTLRGLKQAKLKEIDRLHQMVAEQASEIANLKAALRRESTQIIELASALESQGQAFKIQLSDMQPQMGKLLRLLKRDNNGKTPLYIAAQDGDAEAIIALESTKENVDMPDNDDGFTPAYVAAKFGHTEAIIVLHAAGANMNMQARDGATPVYAAAQNGHAAAITTLHAAGADVNTPIQDGRTPAYIAAEKGYISVIAALIAVGANVNTPNNDGATPVYAAAQNGHAAVITALRAAGADVNAPMQGRRTPAYIAAEKGYISVIAALIAAGANVNTPNNDGATPVYAAAQNGHAVVITALCAAGANVNTPNNDGATPVYAAAQNGHAVVITALCAAGANVNTPCPQKNSINNHSYTPICIAVEKGYISVIAALIAAGANVNKQTRSSGLTPVMLAAGKGDARVVTALLEAGADASVKTAYGTALERAKNSSGCLEVFRILEAHLKQYPDGVGPIRVVNKEVVFHAKPFSSIEQKNPPMLTQFQTTVNPEPKPEPKPEEDKTRKTKSLSEN